MKNAFELKTNRFSGIESTTVAAHYHILPIAVRRFNHQRA